MNVEERKILAEQSIAWQGDFSDDCSAHWAGLLLRAEWMDHHYWWWAVYDMADNEKTIDSSNLREEKCISGTSAREIAQSVARAYIEDIIRNCQCPHPASFCF